jgi:tetratricopeptide (TPR) repeat protein
MVELGKVRSLKPKRSWNRKIGGLGAAFALAGLLQVTGLPGLFEAGLTGIEDAQAQRAKREKPKTKASKSVSDKVNKELLKAQVAIEEGSEAEAIAILNRLLQTEMKPFERAVVLRMSGGLLANSGDYTRAISAFERAERLNAFEEKEQADLLYFLGQLYLAEDRVDDAIRALERWFAQAGETASAQAYFTLAQAYAIKENYRRALQLSEDGLAKARLAEDLRENWFRFVSSMYYQNKQVKNMQTLLREMVGLFPGKQVYWSQLSSTYAILEDDTTAYHMRVMMDLQGMILKSNDFSTLAQLHVFNDVPIRGVDVMQRGFASERVEKTSKNYETLAMSFQEAREWKKAIPPLSEAASRSDDGDLYVRLCQSYLIERQYSRAERACAQGVNKGKLKDTGNAWMLLGTARYSQDKLVEARKAFVTASRYERSEKNALRWIRYLNQEIARAKRKAAAASNT